MILKETLMYYKQKYEPGRPSRARSANTRYPAGRPHSPPANRMYATDVRQTSDSIIA